MADNLTDVAETKTLKWLVGEGAAEPATFPLQLALITDVTAPTDSTIGSEVSGGSYARRAVTFGAVSGGAVSNSAEIRFTDMPGTNVAHVEVWDNAATPVRWWHGPILDATQTPVTKTVNAGDDFVVPVGDLDLSLT